MVFVISKSGKPLMPTKKHGMVRILLKEKKAKVIDNKPFTIQLLYETKEYTQPITLGIDSGYSYIGYSAVTESEELIGGEVELLKGQKDRLKDKAMHRRNRRSRLRHRKPRFNNRKRKEGWLAPSLQHKLDSHERFISKIKKILPITKVIMEIAEFDAHKLKNPKVSGADYQNGEQKDFFNLRQYILHRDKYKCQVCGAEDTVFQVHHIGYWKKDMSNRPQNLMTICIKCHIPRDHEKSGKLWGLEPINKGFKEATFMTLIRSRLAEKLDFDITYGYITKHNRIELGLDKSHHNDALVIAGGKNQEKLNIINFIQVRRNNRSLEKFYDAKYLDTRTKEKKSGKELDSGRRRRNKNHSDNAENLRKYRGHKVSKGRRSIRKQRYFYQPNDLIKYDGKIYTVGGTHNKGASVSLKEINKSITPKKLTLYRFSKGLKAI